MRQQPGFVLGVGLTLLVSLSLAFSLAQSTSDPIIDANMVYLPAIARNYPDFFPPPLQAGEEGWLRKWSEAQEPNWCLQLSGTPYYLEREPGAPGWLAAVVETALVPELELELHINDRVAITGRIEYFDTQCDFPKLYADHLEVIEMAPGGR